MSEVPVWLGRKFSFELPVDLYPNLRVRLRGTPARLEEMTRDLSRERLTYKPASNLAGEPAQNNWGHSTKESLAGEAGGKWSIQENAGHLLDLEPLWSRRVEEFLAGAEVLAAADMKNLKTHQARHNDRALTEILAAFRAARQALVERFDGLGREDFARVAHHPRLGVNMRLVDHVYFIGEHDDHHLTRIWELCRAV